VHISIFVITSPSTISAVERDADMSPPKLGKWTAYPGNYVYIYIGYIYVYICVCDNLALDEAVERNADMSPPEG